jgi:hypothetical protein
MLIDQEYHYQVSFSLVPSVMTKYIASHMRACELVARQIGN